jgi:hypothetical protein
MIKDGAVIKRVITSNNPDHRFLCIHYQCRTCGKPSSPIIARAFVYDAQLEIWKRQEEIRESLEKDFLAHDKEEHFGELIARTIDELYTTHLSLPIGENAIYSKPEIVELLIRSIIDQQASEMSSNILNIPGRGRKAPSSDTLMIYLGRMDEMNVRSDIRQIFDTINNKAKSLGWYSKPIRVAVDFHLEPYYGKKRKKTIHVPKKKASPGTSYAFKYATCDVVVDGKRLTVFGQHITCLDQKSDIFEEVVEYVKNTLNIDVLLVDREFFTVDIMKYLNGQGERESINYIVPAIKNKRVVREAGKRFHKGEYVFDYHFGTDNGGIDIKLFTIPNKDFDVSKPASKKNVEYYVFSTDLPINIADTTAENCRHMDPKRYDGHMRNELADVYSSRWGIETDYRVCAHEFRAITTSNKFPIRYLYFFSGAIFRNIWVLCKQMYQADIIKWLGKTKLRAKVWKDIIRSALDHRAISKTLQKTMTMIDELVELLDVSVTLSSIFR